MFLFKIHKSAASHIFHIYVYIYAHICVYIWSFHVALVVKNPPANAEDIRDWVRTIPWRRAWQPTPVFLLGESHGQRSLAGYSP